MQEHEEKAAGPTHGHARSLAAGGDAEHACHQHGRDHVGREVVSGVVGVDEGPVVQKPADHASEQHQCREEQREAPQLHGDGVASPGARALGGALGLRALGGRAGRRRPGDDIPKAQHEQDPGRERPERHEGFERSVHKGAHGGGQQAGQKGKHHGAHDGRALVGGQGASPHGHDDDGPQGEPDADRCRTHDAGAVHPSE